MIGAIVFAALAVWLSFGGERQVEKNVSEQAEAQRRGEP